MNNKKKKVIFIYEGVKAEEELLKNMAKVFFSLSADISILNCPADGNIYMLWTRLKKDEFNTNVIDVLKEMSSVARERLENYKESDFCCFYLNIIRKIFGIMLLFYEIKRIIFSKAA